MLNIYLYIIITNLIVSFIQTAIFLKLNKIFQLKHVLWTIIIAEIALVLGLLVNIYSTWQWPYLEIIIPFSFKIIVATLAFYYLSKRQIRLYRSLWLSLLITISGDIVYKFLTLKQDLMTPLIIISVIFIFKLIAAFIYRAATRQSQIVNLAFIATNLVLLPLIFIFNLLGWPIILYAFTTSIILEIGIIHLYNKNTLRWKRTMWLTIMANSPIILLVIIFTLFYLGNQVLIG